MPICKVDRVVPWYFPSHSSISVRATLNITELSAENFIAVGDDA